MGCENRAPHPVPEAILATQGGRFGLNDMGFKDPAKNNIAHASTILGYAGQELKVTSPDGNVSYWTLTGEHIVGYPPNGNFTHSIWTEDR